MGSNFSFPLLDFLFHPHLPIIVWVQRNISVSFLREVRGGCKTTREEQSTVAKCCCFHFCQAVNRRQGYGWSCHGLPSGKWGFCVGRNSRRKVSSDLSLHLRGVYGSRCALWPTELRGTQRPDKQGLKPEAPLTKNVSEFPRQQWDGWKHYISLTPCLLRASELSGPSG